MAAGAAVSASAWDRSPICSRTRSTSARSPIGVRCIAASMSPSSATLVAFCDSKMTGCGGIRSQLICDELVWDKAIFLQQLAHEFQRGTLVPFRLDQHIEDLALGVDGSPQIDHAAIDFQIDLVEGRLRIQRAF